MSPKYVTSALRRSDLRREKDLAHMAEKLAKSERRAQRLSDKAESSRIDALFAAGRGEVALANQRAEGIATALATKVEDTRVAASASVDAAAVASNSRIK